jgi:hypothetical protein
MCGHFPVTSDSSESYNMSLLSIFPFYFLSLIKFVIIIIIIIIIIIVVNI